ncbi:cytochrome d ubiquinol oxidase subunit II [Streptomyces kebangsaanensis]|uniref:cytochrome d ubiquinol oxidase subunit II n=1 Tax=Streptomyces kebangsaanensis TaxID=864058 RepID=UPI0009402AA5|nr:cytochrome d ubiquinol oxidase subunit II [Streptomyces kebangsaanensis]
MELVATVLLAGCSAAYFMLGGADIGLGMALPYLGRDCAERRRAGSVLWPLSLVHEGWLLLSVAVLAGCFPALAGDLAGGLRAVLLPLLVGWLVRNAGLCWRAAGGGPVCETLVVVSSYVLACGWGWTLASVVDEEPDRPAPPVTGAPTAVAVALLFLAHGMGSAARRLTGAPFQRAHLLTGGQAGGPSSLLTSVVMAVLPLLAGHRLPLTEYASDGVVQRLLLPLLICAVPLLLAARARLRRRSGTRAAGPPGR